MPAETPSPSPLTPEPPLTVTEVDRLAELAQADADRWVTYRASFGGDFSKVNVDEALKKGLVGAAALGLISFLPHVRALAARVSDLEAANETLQGWSQGVESRAEVLKVERDGAVERARLCLEAKDWWMERAVKADAAAQDVRRAWDAAVGLEDARVSAAINALCPPVPEDKKEALS